MRRELGDPYKVYTDVLKVNGLGNQGGKERVRPGGNAIIFILLVQ